MDSADYNTEKETPSEKITERDVLGLEKKPVTLNSPKARPNRIFIVMAIFAAAALVYWLVTR